MIITLIAFVGGLALLYAGGEALVRSAGAIGLRFGLSPLVVGLTIVAAATSAPELAVTVHASLDGVSGLAVGNVVGSNICNLTLVLGLVALVSPLRLRDKLRQSDIGAMLIATFLVPALILDGSISRLEGSILLLAICAYTVYTMWQTQVRDGEPDIEPEPIPAFTANTPANVGIAAGGAAFLVIGSSLLVDACIDIATVLGVPPAVIGLSAAAFGTSLPEVAASVIAARHGHGVMAAGNLIGSNIFNLLLVTGGGALAAPLIPGAVRTLDIAIMIFTTLLAVALILVQKQVGRGSGALLLASYFSYLGWLFTAP